MLLSDYIIHFIPGNGVSVLSFRDSNIFYEKNDWIVSYIKLPKAYDLKQLLIIFYSLDWAVFT